MKVLTTLICESVPSKGYWKGYLLYSLVVSLAFFVPMTLQMGVFGRHVADSTFLLFLALAMPVGPLKWWVGAIYGVSAMIITSIFQWLAGNIYTLSEEVAFGTSGTASIGMLFVLSIVAGTQQARFLYPDFWRLVDDEHCDK
jgi:hypothetical protein